MLINRRRKKLIEKVLKIFYFDYAGIDIIYKNNKPVINEIEDVVGARMVCFNTDFDIIEEFVKYIKGVYFNEV